MRVLIENISREPEQGRVRITVQFGDEPSKGFLAEYDGTDEKFKCCSVEHELFMRLSDLALKRFCNCCIYQFELMEIINAFLSKKSLPSFPIELGTTQFGFRRPSEFRILVDRLRRPFLIAWCWWQTRHIRRENILKYGKDP
jgi:hypothetical protein